MKNKLIVSLARFVYDVGPMIAGIIVVRCLLSGYAEAFSSQNMILIVGCVAGYALGRAFRG